MGTNHRKGVTTGETPALKRVGRGESDLPNRRDPTMIGSFNLTRARVGCGTDEEIFVREMT